jgi:hypothetical protein
MSVMKFHSAYRGWVIAKRQNMRCELLETFIGCKSGKSLPKIDPSFRKNASLNGVFGLQKGQYVNKNIITQKSLIMSSLQMQSIKNNLYFCLRNLGFV